MGFEKLVDKYSDKPVDWIHDFISFEGLDFQGLTDQQEEICYDLVKHRRLCIAAGGGIGKSALVAMLIQWFLITHPGSRIPTTAPTARQLHDVLFSEVGKWLSRNKLKDFYRLLRGKLHIVGYPEWYAVARTVPKDSRAINGTLAGFHAKSMLIVVDEAADVPDGVFTALDGSMTSDNCYIILISNPVSSGGYFYDTITDPKGKGAGFKVSYYSSADSPLVSQSYIEQIISRYGKDSAMYKAKVLGQPISLYDNVVVDPKTYDEVVTFNKKRFDGRVVLGVDVGGSGDDPTVICHRIGNSIVRWDTYETGNTVFIADEIDKLCNMLYQGKDVYVVIDAIGVGAGLWNVLSSKPKWYNLVEHKGSMKAEDEQMYKNRRTEVYYTLHKQFKNLHFPVAPPERLKKELANLLFELHSGPINMEEKKRFRSRLNFSPDHADALSLTCAVDIYSKDCNYKVDKKSIKVLSMLSARSMESRYGRYSIFV